MGSLQASIHSAVTGLVGGLILLYIAAQTLAETIIRFDDVSPGWRAFSHSIPIVAAAVVAACLGQGATSVGILTGSSVAIMSLAPGVCQVVAPVQHPSSEWTALWRILLPVTLLFWLVGFHGRINWLNGSFLAFEGLAILWLWQEPTTTLKGISPLRIVIFILATALAIVAAILAIKGAMHERLNLPTLTPGVLSSGIIAPVLVLPVLGESVRLAEHRRSVEARTTQVALTTINLCAGVPLCVLASYIRPYFSTATPRPLPFPIGTWRIDAVLLVILSLWLLPTSIRRRTSARVEGTVFILIYALYLISIAWVAFW